MRVSCRAPAKVIISGEHSVVYGYPALVAAVNVYSKVIIETVDEFGPHEICSEKYGIGKVIGGAISGPAALKPLAKVVSAFCESESFRGKLKIRVSSDIPPASGMGSSASISVALAYALLKTIYDKPPEEKVFKLAMEGEKIAHANPSGVDVAAALQGGLILFVKDKGFERLEAGSGIFLLADSGMERSTKEMVSKVASLREKEPDLFNITMTSISEITNRIARLLGSDLVEAGRLMTLNHLLLSLLGVSNSRLDSIVWTSISAGAYGAKLTGGGGGGCVLTLVDEKSLNAVEGALRNLNAPTRILRTVEKGVYIEEVD
ncbi:MAG: mevalonate kinase [Candidatus Brockarchaeota archaeon]|nr:mevalonate kinase [Candidatus Brockarchaeota archaeon]